MNFTLTPYTFHINLYDLAFLIAIITGFNFFLLIWFSKRINQASDKILCLILVTSILWMISVLFTDTRLDACFTKRNSLPLQHLLVIGPLIYLYVLKLTRPEYKLRYKHLLHFGPLMLELGI